MNDYKEGVMWGEERQGCHLMGYLSDMGGEELLGDWLSAGRTLD